MLNDDDDEWLVEPDYLPPWLGLQRAEALPRMSDLLLREAELLLEKHEANNDRLAVILSHAACDVQMEETLAMLFVSRDVRDLYDPVKSMVGNQISLHADRVRKFYTALSGDNPTTQPWWPDWRGSVSRRNGVAHGGHLVNSEAAAKSLAACRACVRHLQAVLARHIPPAYVSAE